MKETAIVKMSDAESAERVREKLNKISCFDSKLDFTLIGDRANRVLSTRRTFVLPDGSESMKDFTSSFKNRGAPQRAYPFPSAVRTVNIVNFGYIYLLIHLKGSLSPPRNDIHADMLLNAM